MNMEIIQDIFNLCVIPLLGVITAYLVKIIKKKTDEISSKADNELVEKYSQILSESIQAAVVSTNQTYVSAMKNKKAFDKEAQEEAFRLTYDKVMTILTDDAKSHLGELYGDLEQYLTVKIEAVVSEAKTASVDKEVVATATATATAAAAAAVAQAAPVVEESK